MFPADMFPEYVFTWPREMIASIKRTILEFIWTIFSYIFEIITFFDLIFWYIFWVSVDYVIWPTLSFQWAIISYIPSLMISVWNEIMKFIYRPLDIVCAWSLQLWEDVADFILTFWAFPIWDTAFLEVPFAIPILVANNWWEA